MGSWFRTYGVLFLVLCCTYAHADVAQGAKSLGLSPWFPSVPIRQDARNTGERATGRALYTFYCASCHGAHLTGSEEVPSLLGAGGSAVDFYVTTGRMPGVTRGLQALHAAPYFTPQQIRALDAYVDAHATVRIPLPILKPEPHLLVLGRALFEEDCEACHGVAGEGATAGGAWTALPLDKATPLQIGEAIRIGPGVMPRFTTAQLSDRDIAALVTYIDYLNTKQQSYGGWTMGYLGPVAEGAVAAFVGVGALFWVISFIGTKADGSRVHKRS